MARPVRYNWRVGAEQILLAELQRSIARQEAAVDAVRERAARLLAASSLLAGLFAVATSDATDRHGTARFWALIFAGLLVLWVAFLEIPRNFSFDRNLGTMLDSVYENATYSDRDVALPMARGLQLSIDANLPKLSRLWVYYQVGLVLVVIQLVLWVAAFVNIGDAPAPVPPS